MRQRRGTSGGNWYLTKLSYLGEGFTRIAFESYRQGRVTKDELAGHLNVKARNLESFERQIGWIVLFDTNVFITLGYYYQKRFPTIWGRMDALADGGELISVREVRRELDLLCSSDHVNKWIERYRHIFLIASNEECKIVANIFRSDQYRGLVRRKNILRGSPVADPFLIAAAKTRNGIVVTQESAESNGARIPAVCSELSIQCINLESFLEQQGLEF